MVRPEPPFLERERIKGDKYRERKKKAAKGFVLCIFGEREVMGTLFSFQLGILSTKQNPLDGWQPGDGDFWPVFIFLLFYLFYLLFFFTFTKAMISYLFCPCFFHAPT